MSLNTFSSHLSEVGSKLQEFRVIVDELDGLLGRHGHNNYTDVLPSEFDTEQVTKAEYDAAMSSISNLVDTWLPAGHGTNIDNYLYEVPETTP